MSKTAKKVAKESGARKALPLPKSSKKRALDLEEPPASPEAKAASKSAPPAPIKKRAKKPVAPDPEVEETTYDPEAEPVASDEGEAEGGEAEGGEAEGGAEGGEAEGGEGEGEAEGGEGEGEAEAGEEDEAAEKRRRAALTRRRKKAKLVGYRALARQAGYVDRLPGDATSAAGPDGLYSLLSLAEAARLTKFIPASPESVSFGLDEFQKRHDLFKEGVPASVARETQARCDAVLRSVMNSAVLRAVETGRKGVNASTMCSVLREYADRMLFTAVAPPLGLVRHAQDEGAIPSVEGDKEKKAAERKETLKAKKIHEDWTKAEAERLSARRAAREGVAATPAAAEEGA
jgi:hypothetical protein